MRELSSQQYRLRGQELGIDPAVLKNAVAAIEAIKTKNSAVFPLLTLKHLSVETGVSYGYLRNVIARKIYPYRHFNLKKRLPGRSNVRMISIPSEQLLVCQKWISQNILRHVAPHLDSYAYHPNSNPIHAARQHAGAAWLIKVDIRDFFHAVSEHRVYGMFRSLGFSKLLSLELARLCTMAVQRANSNGVSSRYEESAIGDYRSPFIGVLPQGAPSSPMISNLVMRNLDAKLSFFADKVGMRFSRYADDIVFSCRQLLPRSEVMRVKRQILQMINEEGFKPNLRKTVVRGRGSRRIVLGLLVDGSRPRLTNEFKDTIRLHLYYLMHNEIGPSKHALARKTSVSKIYHHVFGLICWARAVEPVYGGEAMKCFNSVPWPPIVKAKYFD
jgi:RNA-directed DNA polymerase